nr:hypothetical protein Iba_chr02aCG13810 [Ipomoea batatas]
MFSMQATIFKSEFWSGNLPINTFGKRSRVSDNVETQRWEMVSGRKSWAMVWIIAKIFFHLLGSLIGDVGPPGHQTLQPTLVHPKPPPPHPPPIPSPSPQICSSSSPRTRTQAARTRLRPVADLLAIGSGLLVPVAGAARTAEAGAERRKDSQMEEPRTDYRTGAQQPGSPRGFPWGRPDGRFSSSFRSIWAPSPASSTDVAEADLGGADEGLHVLGRVGVDDVDVQRGVLDAIRFERNHEGFIPVRIGVAFLVHPGGALGLWVDPPHGVVEASPGRNASSRSSSPWPI